MCSICNSKFKFQAKRKKFEKVLLEAKLERQDSTLKDVFSAVGIQITPDKGNVFVCRQYQIKVGHVNKYLSSKSELKNIASKEAYLGQKILLTRITPCIGPDKRARVSTPRKRCVVKKKKFVKV